MFDVDNNMVGLARANCSQDLNQIKHERELILAGQQLELAISDETCDLSGFKNRAPR